jgi:DNA-directed RNA polymerase specialized sigma24 family protein
MVTIIEGLNLEQMWESSQKHVHYKWRDHHDVEELKSLASQSFVEFVNEWAAWCERHDRATNSAGLFYTLAKRKISWDVFAYFEDNPLTPSLDDTFEDGELRTQLRARVRDSLLHHTIVRAIPDVTTVRERAALALVCYEELPVGKAAAVMDIHHTKVVQALNAACERILLVALHHIKDADIEAPKKPKPRTWIPSDHLTTWVYQQYGVDLDTYLNYVQAHYNADVSYLVEMIDRSNGITYTKTFIPRYSGRLTESNIEDIYTRLANNEPKRNIAQLYGVSETYIGKLAHRPGPRAQGAA